MPERDNTSASGCKCPQCGAELPANTPPELCPKCLLKAGLPAQPNQPATGPGGTVALPPPPASSRGLPQPGELLGHYTIIRLLGAGGMGAVYEAEDLESGRRVALKVLSHTLDSPQARERFFREGRLAASINHPNSVYVFGTEEIGGTPVIVMELVSGGTLQDRLRSRGPLPVGEAVDIALQIIAGLEAAQRLGILHRDIKPSNCYVADDGAVKIGDFGLSISTGVRMEPALTATGAFLGTPAFCSPEQLRGEELNTRSDMYAVGATLFYLLTGRTPFEAKNVVALLATILEQRPPSPRKFRPEIPAGLAKVVLRCLEKQPGERFKSYADLRQALVLYSSMAPTPAMLGLRFVAGVLDHFLLSLGSALILLPILGSPFDFLNLAGRGSPKALLWAAIGLAISVCYFTVLEGIWGASAGKALCRLRVVRPDNNPPGLLRGLVRALLFVVTPALPSWVISGGDLSKLITVSTWVGVLVQTSAQIVIGLLFCTVRRRNGFAAVHDLLTRTRVISLQALRSRPVLAAMDEPPPAVESAPQVGPYHVLKTLDQDAGTEWLQGYDLRLLRKVWIRKVPPGTAPIPGALRSIGRIGRLRWLAGRRAPDENWDAFEALTGQPFLALARTRQPWSHVRFWLHDLASEVSLAEKECTLLPVLAPDRVWITADGRAKLLDFPAPGLAAPISNPPSTLNSQQSTINFLGSLAAAGLEGGSDAAARSAGKVAVPLPLHARTFLKALPQMSGAGAAAAALKPLLQRVAEVSRLRRAAVVAGCLALPVFVGLLTMVGMSMMQRWGLPNSGVMVLSSLLQHRHESGVWVMRKDKAGVHLSVGPYKDSRPAGKVPDRLVALFIAGHYRSLITNDAAWNNPFAQRLVKGEARKFAEQSITQYPTPTETEIAEADAALKPLLPPPKVFEPGPLSVLSLTRAAFAIYVCCPALIAALLFRGGLVLRIAGVTFIRRDGVQASRLRLFWRTLVAWSPLLLAVFGPLQNYYERGHAALGQVLLSGLVCALAILSVALPTRGLQDRLAGTWPVPR